MPVADPSAWGVERGYHDALGVWREPPPGVIDTILASMGAVAGADPYAAVPMVTVRTDHPLPALPAGTLLLEDGGAVRVDGHLPDGIPFGYHRLQVGYDRPPVPLVVSPGRCPLPPGEGPSGGPLWGWAAQLYAARSSESWGIGDLADLRRLAAWSARLGAGMALVNPLHAPLPGPSQEASPYFASSRCFASPLYLRVEEVPGAAQLDDLDELIGAGRALNDSRLIDRDRVWALKSAALEQLFWRFGGDPEFDRYRAARGSALAGFATFNALAEVFGLPWQDWPAEFRRPDGPAVATFATGGEGPRRVRYHQWLQWHVDRQLTAAAEPVGVVQDLAIGVNAGGADSWLWQDTFAADMRVGAPPDEFNTVGQDWGLPPWDPWRLRATGYAPFIETLRSGFRHAGGLRFDHVMGLFRLYWIPEGRPASDGTYVRYPHWDLLNILALEAHRAGAYVVGEDLGTVEDRVRNELQDRNVLSYRLLWFEPERPAAWPTQALGAVTTHDLPTIPGVWSGSDLETQRALDLSPNEAGSRAMRHRLVDWTGVADGAEPAVVVDGAHRVLAEAPCAILTATLDDATLEEERPNLPGTTTERPNWSIALPQTLDEIERSPLARRIADHLARGRPAP